MNVEKIRRLMQRKLSAQYPSGMIPVAEARGLVVELLVIVTRAADCFPAESRRTFLAGLAERLAAVPKPWQ